ncbi:dihydroneopterin aldolase [Paenibacillus sp. y28]|uniref:dihydroneopterin aldolase n=1 Tax=Paenibacillus sp. y28 TaxID=3129110 RepID=UPI0030188FC6
MDRMVLQNMHFYGYHGAIAEENKLGQRFMVDLELYLDLRRAGQTDDLNETVNYAEVFAAVQRIVEGKPFQLIEALAEAIASELLQLYTKLEQITVRLKKPHPPFAVHFDFVCVEIHRKRAE